MSPASSQDLSNSEPEALTSALQEIEDLKSANERLMKSNRASYGLLQIASQNDPALASRLQELTRSGDILPSPLTPLDSHEGKAANSTQEYRQKVVRGYVNRGQDDSNMDFVYSESQTGNAQAQSNSKTDSGYCGSASMGLDSKASLAKGAREPSTLPATAHIDDTGEHSNPVGDTPSSVRPDAQGVVPENDLRRTRTYKKWPPSTAKRPEPTCTPLEAYRDHDDHRNLAVHMYEEEPAEIFPIDEITETRACDSPVESAMDHLMEATPEPETSAGESGSGKASELHSSSRPMDIGAGATTRRTASAGSMDTNWDIFTFRNGGTENDLQDILDTARADGIPVSSPPVIEMSG